MGGRGQGANFASPFGPTGFEEWGGYMNAKRQKLMDQFDDDRACNSNFISKSEIFKGVAIFVNGLTTPPAAELRRIMLEHGGAFHTYFSRSQTTHVVVSSMAESKKTMFDKLRVVNADWIVDSLKAGSLQDWHDYRFKSETVKGQKSADKFFKRCKEETETKPESEPDVDESVGSTESAFIASNHQSPPETSFLSSSFSTIGRPQDPDFLSEYFKNSRLHHISQLGAEWKEYVRKLQDENPKRFPGRDRLKTFSAERVPSGETVSRVVMHVDMDCFFVSVGLISRPDLRGKPVAVTHSKNSGSVRARPGADLAYEMEHYRSKREKKLKTESGGGEKEEPIDIRVKSDPSLSEMSTSEIASCSYEARAAGVKNGSFLGAAKKLCPSLVTIPYDFEGYRRVSKILYDTVASYTTSMEAVSCDECFVDLTETIAATGADAETVAAAIREDVRAATSCPASAGLGPNRLVARLATRVAKPDGQFRVCEDGVAEFMRGQSAKDLPGVGRATMSKLTKMGVASCADFQQVSLSVLQKEFGSKMGESLHDACRGKDDRPIDSCKVRKSVSVDVNYGIRFERPREPFLFLDKLSLEMETRLKNLDIMGKHLSLKVLVRSKDAPRETAKFGGHGIVDHLNKSVALARFTRDAGTISRECGALLESMGVTGEDGDVDVKDIRGMSLTMTKLDNQSAATTIQSGLRNIADFIKRKRRSSGQSSDAADDGDQKSAVHDSMKDWDGKIEGDNVPLNGESSIFRSNVNEPEHGTIPCQVKSSHQEETASECVHNETIPIDSQAGLVDLLPLAQIKPLIKEWLRSGPPRHEDLNFACGLLLSCIYDENDLETVFVLCKMFVRLVKKGEISEIWQHAFYVMIQIVQDCVEKELGHPFLLN